MKTELPIILAVLSALAALHGVRCGNARSGWIRSSRLFPAVWILIFVFPYVAFGPSSYLWMDDEGDLLVPFHYYMAKFADGAHYSHLLGAGGDLQGSFLIGGELLSPERLLMRVFPLWLAIALHKALTCAFGFAGHYLLARRVGGVGRQAALALAAFGTVFWFRMILVTYGTGMTLALIPLGVYLLVGRLGRRWWWAGAFAYAAAAGLWMIPTEGAPAVSIAVVGAMILTRRYHWRPFAGIALIGLAIGANWCESLYAMLQVMSESARGTDVSPEIGLLFSLRVSVSTYFGLILVSARQLGAEIIISVAFLALAEVRRIPRVALVVILPVLFMVGFLIFPWSHLGMAGVQNAGIRYFSFASTATATLIAAQAIVAWERRGFGFVPKAVGGAAASLPVLLVLTSAFAISGWFLGFQLINLFYRSGQAHYHVSNLENPTWFDASNPARTVSLRASYLQPEPGVMLAYGLPYFDAWLNLMDGRFLQYWADGVNTHDPVDPRIGYDWGQVRNGVVQIDEMVSVPLLAAANVGYLISALPVSGKGLVLLDGPEHPQLEKPGRSGASPMEYYRDRWSRIFDLGKMHVYALPRPLPRVWAAADVRTMNDEVAAGVFLSEVAASAPDRIAVIRQTHRARLESAAAHRSMMVRRFDLVRNGFEMDLDAPEGGLLMVNAVATRHFRAWADGKETPYAEANGVQTAIAVPAGTRHVSLCYGRPTLLPQGAKHPRECGIAAPHSP